MLKNKRKIFLKSEVRLLDWSVVFLVLFFVNCSLIKSTSKLEPVKVEVQLQDTSVSMAKGDTVASIHLGLKNSDSSISHSSEASQLYIQTLDNYLKVAPEDEKIPEILLWKGNHFYNEGDFPKALEVYEFIRKKFPGTSLLNEVSQMVAQCFAQMGRLDDAEKTYRSMLNMSDVGAQVEARERLAQSIYLQAEKNEKEEKLQTASEGYGRVAQEFPTSEIAAVAQFNAGVMQEKQKKWKEAIRLYERFFDGFFESPLLAKVLFREAKCRELDGQWEIAGQKYLNLVRTYPESPDAEPSLYNAGFAFFNAKKADSAAKAFELYAKKYPQNAEAPNLLFKAVEIYGEQQNWEKVGELQTLFTRRYASDKNRLIQALCMGGTAAYQRGRREETMTLMNQVIREYAMLKSADPSSRFYAAQAQHTLGELAQKKMLESLIRPQSFDADIKQKTHLLKLAVDEFLKVLEFRIVDWTIRSSFSLGNSFEEFGSQVFLASRKSVKSAADQLDQEEDAIASLTGAFSRAQQQYQQVLAISRKQDVHNKWTDDAEVRIVLLAAKYGDYQAKAMALIPQLIKVDVTNPEKAIAGKLQLIGRFTTQYEQGLKYLLNFFEIAQANELNRKEVEALHETLLLQVHDLGKLYLGAAEMARSAPFPSGFQPMERFFYQVKLLQDGIPKLEAKSLEYFSSGLEFSTKYHISTSPVNDSLRLYMGRSLYIQSKCLDLLSQEALTNPPIPLEAGPEQRKTYAEKIENVGYQLQDQALERYHALIEKVKSGMVSSEWGELAFARIIQIEPDKWIRTADVDSTLDIYSSEDWLALSEFPKSGWPIPENPSWRRTRMGVIPKRDFPVEMPRPWQFIWSGEKGLGPQVDSVIANYIPAKQFWSQTQFTLPDHVTDLEVMVVAPQEWSVQIDNEAILSFKENQGPWEKGVSKNLGAEIVKKMAPGKHFLRIYAQNLKPTEGFGIWLRLRIRYKLQADGAVFPWSQIAPSPEYLKKLREQPIFIKNFTDRELNK